jgi:hypothetical protein
MKLHRAFLIALGIATPLWVLDFTTREVEAMDRYVRELNKQLKRAFA